MAASIHDFALFAKLQAAGCDLCETKPGEWDGRCPCDHQAADKRKLHVEVGDRNTLIVTCEAGVGHSFGEIVRAVGGLASDSYPKFRGSPNPSGSPTKPKKKIVATYDYLAADGKLLHQTVRFEPKEFRQRQPNAHGGWDWTLTNVETVLYRLPQILAADPTDTIVLVEGEKDADKATTKLGLTTTTPPMGAKKWKPSYTATLRGRHVVIVPDNDKPDEKTGKGVGWEHVVTVANALHGVAASVRVVSLPNPPVAGQPPLVPKWDISDWIAAGGTRDQFDEAVISADVWNPTANPTKTHEPNEAENDPHRLARLFIDHYRFNGKQTLRFWRDEWWRWKPAMTCFCRVPVAELRAELGAVIKAEFDQLNIEKLKRYSPADDGDEPPKVMQITNALLGNVTSALSGLCIASLDVEQPSWFAGPDFSPPIDAAQVIPTRSKLIHLPSLIADEPCAIDPTPEFFSSAAVTYPFDVNARCPAWLKFLESLWPDDPETIDALQEWFGYLLLPDTSQQKMLMLIGPRRAGKGTIGRVLKSLVGQHSIASPTLRSLSEQFGLWGLVGKSVALIPDARLTAHSDAIAIVERLLSISGEDDQDIQRKNLTTLMSVRLPTRFVIMSNEMPNLRDSSGAFASRLILLRIRETFLDRENKALTGQLLAEMPGILNWAIDGWERLQHRGKFTQPESGDELLREFGELSSPVSLFVEEFCDLGREHETTKDELFDAWKNWCKAHNRDHEGTKESFFKELRASVHTISESRPRKKSDGKKSVEENSEGKISRPRTYRGIRVKISPSDGFGPGWSGPVPRNDYLFN